MKIFYLVLAIFMVSTLKGFAQKQALDIPGMSKWEKSLQNPAISDDGEYVSYQIQNGLEKPTLIVQNLSGSWKKEFAGVEWSMFQPGGGQIILHSGETIIIQKLGDSKLRTVSQVKHFIGILSFGKKIWMLYEAKRNFLRQLCFLDLASTSNYAINNIQAYYRNSQNGEKFIVEQKIKDRLRLSWFDISDGSLKVVWEGNKINKFFFDVPSESMAFIGTQDNGKEQLWTSFKGSLSKPIPSVNPLLLDSLNSMEIEAMTENGDKVVLSKPTKAVRPLVNYDKAKVDIYSFFDATPQDEQIKEMELTSKIYLSVDISTGSYSDINNSTEFVMQPEEDFKHGKTWPNNVVIKTKKGLYDERYWNKKYSENYWIANILTGERKSIPIIPLINKWMINDYILGRLRSDTSRNIYSYQISTGNLVNLTAGIIKDIQEDDLAWGFGQTIGDKFQFKLIGILKDNMSILIRDNYDIWQVDLNGKKSLSVTKGIGRKSGIYYRLNPIFPRQAVYARDEELLLSAFELATNNSGFYKARLGSTNKPVRLVMSPDYYDFPDIPRVGGKILKARFANVYILERQNASCHANYYVTKDFNRFKAITDLHPEKDFNWLTSELVSFRTLDGREEKAVIYKPQNFDPSKKYPVIFYYYEQLSFLQNVYQRPELPKGRLSIPFMVSNGYVIVTPDIHYHVGKAGTDAVNTILGVANYVKHFSWTDQKHMGLQGHSFGGFETNMVITNSQMFAAAVVGSGPSSRLFSYIGGRNTYFSENGQPRMGMPLWQDISRYITQSPIVKVSAVNTPILFMHNKGDGAVPFREGFEMFSALRRLGKPAWLLQYDDEGHIILKNENAKDYAIRMLQFFDYYLKGKAAATWMTKGRPAELKGIDDRFELDLKNGVPESDLLNPIGKKTADSLQRQYNNIMQTKR